MTDIATSVYEDEASSIIAYALTSAKYQRFCESREFELQTAPDAPDAKSKSSAGAGTGAPPSAPANGTAATAAANTSAAGAAAESAAEGTAGGAEAVDEASICSPTLGGDEVRLGVGVFVEVGEGALTRAPLWWAGPGQGRPGGHVRRRNVPARERASTQRKQEHLVAALQAAVCRPERQVLLPGLG